MPPPFNPYQLLEQTLPPGYMQGPYGMAWNGSMGMMKDYLLDLTKQAIKNKFPPLSQLDSLGLIGQDRGILQAPAESNAAYVSRLVNAWTLWAEAGTAWGVLAALATQGYTTAYMIYTNGQQYGPSSGVTFTQPPGFSQLPYKWTFALNYDGQGDGGGPAVTAVWQAAHAYPLNSLIIPTAGSPLYYRATAISGTGTSGGGIPAFPTNWGGTVTDNAGANQIVWTCQGSNIAPAGNGVADPQGSFWSNGILLFSAIGGALPVGDPAKLWTNVTNPPTLSTAPASTEIANIQAVLKRFGAAHATKLGLAVAIGGTRAMCGWPNRTMVSAGGTLGTLLGSVVFPA